MEIPALTEAEYIRLHRETYSAIARYVLRTGDSCAHQFLAIYSTIIQA